MACVAERKIMSARAARRSVSLWRVSAVPFTQMDAGMHVMVQASDDALSGSEWIEAVTHAPDISKPFVRFYNDGLCRTGEREETHGNNSNSKC